MRTDRCVIIRGAGVKSHRIVIVKKSMDIEC